jgi:hypothetical protein
MARRSSPSSARRSKAYSIASLTVPWRWSASKTAMPSGPQTQASASRVNEVARSLAAVAAMVG